MNKIKRTYWLEPELVDGLEKLRGKLEHPPSLTQLVEDAIGALLAKHKIKIEGSKR